MQILPVISLCVAVSAKQGFLAASKCNQVQLCDAFCKESSLSRAGSTSEKLAALALSVRDCGQSCGCPFGQERIPPTPYPAPPLPPVPAGMFGPYGNGHPGDPRNGGAVLIPPEQNIAPPPAPPLAPLPPVPLADFSTVGDRFLPRLVIPKGEVNEFQDLDYEGNPVPTDPHYNLPPGWTVQMNADGKPYYMNAATGQEGWIHPASPLFKGALMQTQEHLH